MIMKSSHEFILAFRTTIIFTTIIFFTFCLYLYDNKHIPVLHYTQSHSLSKSRWIEVVLRTEIDDPLDLSPLQELCNKTHWRKGLVFECPRPSGGAGLVRNKVLNCIRYTIEAGAGFIIPDITARSKQDLSSLVTENTLDFEYMFSREHLTSYLSIACPQMDVYNNSEDYSRKSWTKTYQRLDVGALITEIPGTPRNQNMWAPAFANWLANQNIIPSREEPVLVNIGHPLFQWPMSYETLGLRKAVGRVLRFNDEVRRLAASTLYALAEAISNTSSSNGVNAQFDPRFGIVPRAFFGAHMRTEQDAKDAGWPTYENQSKHYILQALSHSLSTIFVSCGSKSDIMRFKNESWQNHGIHVLSKDMLLKDDELYALGKLSWDQQALVDYEVLLRSSAFGGIDGSSYSVNIAMRRHLLSNHTFKGDPGSLSHIKGVSISDEFSQIYEGPGSNPLIWLGMWP